MASANYLAELAKISRQPTVLVKLTVTGDLGAPLNTQIFRFSPKENPPLTNQLGEDVRPYLLRWRGRPTRILPVKAITERARMTLTFADDEGAPDFDTTVFTIVDGGSFFRRLKVAQPNLVGSKVEVLQGFVAAGFDESDFETIFSGRFEDIDFQTSGQVSIIAKDELALRDREAPAAISTGNLLDGAISASATAITVDDGDEITDPANLDSKDFIPVTLKIESELIAIGALSGDVATVQQNIIDQSEEFDDADWVKTTTTVTADQDRGPFGGPSKADRLNFTAIGGQVEQDSGVAASGLQFVFSVWLKHDTSNPGADTEVTLELILSDGSESATLQVTAGTGWRRFEVSTTFTGGAGQTAKVRIKRTASDDAFVFAWGAQLEKGVLTRNFYVGTNGNEGDDAGRGAFGTTAASHSDGVAFKEVVAYRQHLTDNGLHPVWIIRDLLNRARILAADVSLTSFDDAADSVGSAEFKRASTTLIDASRKISQHMKEVREQALIDLWASETGLVKVRQTARAIPPQADPFTAKDEEHIILDSLAIDGNAESRITRTAVYWDLIAGEEGDRPEHFNNVQVVVDLAAESLAGPRVRSIFSKWIFRGTEAIGLSGRIVSRFRNGAREVKLGLEFKDLENLFVGDLFVIDSADILSTSGTTATRLGSNWQATQKRVNFAQGRVAIEALETAGKRFAFISPSAWPDYPAATAEERQYGFIGDSNNKVNAGTEEGYFIF